MKSQRHHDLPAKVQGLMANAFSILVVDDVSTNRLLLNRLLTRVGYAVVEAKDGPSALKQIELTQPDLVILDVEMPGISGIEVVAHYRAMETSEERLPIIVASGNPSEAMAESALEVGADAFMTKPFDFPALLNEIRTLLRARRATKVYQRKCRETGTKNVTATNILAFEPVIKDH